MSTAEVITSEKAIQELIKLLRLLSQESIHVRIVLALAKKGCLSLRGIAREVGMAPKNVRKYLERLEALGVIVCLKPSKKMFLYKLSDAFSWLHDLVKSIEQPETKTEQKVTVVH